jgi:hypothetical protein
METFIQQNTDQVVNQSRFSFEFLNELPDADEGTEWFVPGLFIEGGINYLCAYPGHGKSLISLDLAHACTQDRMFLGLFEVPQVKVLILDQDSNSPRELNKRILGFGFGANGRLARMNQQGLRLDLEEHVRWLVSECKKEEIKLVIFDSLVRFHRGSETNPADLAIIREHLQMLTSAGITVIMIHHNSRNKTFRGGSEIIAMADSMVSVIKPQRATNRFVLSIEKRRTLSDTDWDTISVEPVTKDGVTLLKGQPFKAEEDEDLDLHADIIEFCGDEGRTKSEIREHVKGDATRVDQAIQLLLGKVPGLRMDKDGRKKLYFAVEDDFDEIESIE